MWDDGAGQTTTTATNLSPGNYTVGDGNGCTFTTPGTIKSQLTAIGATKIWMYSCNGCRWYGTATAKDTGGNYTYLWDDGAGQTTTTATNLAPGNYTVTQIVMGVRLQHQQ